MAEHVDIIKHLISREDYKQILDEIAYLLYLDRRQLRRLPDSSTDFEVSNKKLRRTGSDG